MQPFEGDCPANDSASGERTTTDVYALPYPQPDTTNGVPYGMLPPFTLANWNVTESGGRGDELSHQAVAHEVELERDARAPAVVERLDDDRALGADGTVEAAEGGSVRRIVLGDLVGDLLAAAGDTARVDRAGADPCRPLRQQLDVLDLRLPLAVPAQVVEVGEDLRRALRDLNRLDDGRHTGRSSHTCGRGSRGCAPSARLPARRARRRQASRRRSRPPTTSTASRSRRREGSGRPCSRASRSRPRARARRAGGSGAGPRGRQGSRRRPPPPASRRAARRGRAEGPAGALRRRAAAPP